jgi:hypothetical protein
MVMKSLVLGLLLLIIVFLLFNGKETYVGGAVEGAVGAASSVTPLPRNYIEMIIEAVQAKRPEFVPLETVFINPALSFQGGNVFNTRMMFYNNKEYYGTQWDIQAQVDDTGASIMSMTPAAAPELDSDLAPYKGPKYREYQDLQKAFDSELESMLSSSRNLPAKEVPF